MSNERESGSGFTRSPTLFVHLLVPLRTISFAAVTIGLAFVALSAPAGAATAPGVGVDPPYGPPLTTIKVFGQGYCAAPCRPVAIQLGSLYVASNVKVSANGTFSTLVRVPGATRPGTVTVTASQQNVAGNVLTASTDFNVTINTPPPTHYAPPASVQAPTAIPPTTVAAIGPPARASATTTTRAPQRSAGARVSTTTALKASSTTLHDANQARGNPSATTHSSSTNSAWIVAAVLAGVGLLALAAYLLRKRRTLAKG